MSGTLVLDDHTLLVIRNALWLTQQTAAAADAVLSSQVEAALKAATPVVAAPPVADPT